MLCLTKYIPEPLFYSHSDPNHAYSQRPMPIRGDQTPYHSSVDEEYLGNRDLIPLRKHDCTLPFALL